MTPSRHALVTGASRGIGRAVALALAEDGVDLIGLHYGTNRTAAEETAAMLADRGATPVLLQADLAVNAPATAERLGEEFLAAATAHSGERRVDILVNNAGINGPQQLGSIDAGTYTRLMDVNVAAPLFLIQRLVPAMPDGARIVNISTGFTRVAAPTNPVYAASKAAINNLTLAFAKPLGEKGVTINAVTPGIIDTDMNTGWLSAPGARDRASSMSVFNRLGDVDDVAQLVRYLASEGARWTTGQTIDVSGGSLI